MNRLGMSMGGLGDIVEVPTGRLAGLPFALHGQHSGNMTLGPPPGNLGSFTLPNNVFSDGITLFSSGGMQLSQLHSLPALQQQDAKLAGLADLGVGGSPGGQRGASLARPSRSNDGNSGKSSSAYASRHQAAEQRRRTRINERLDLLRKMVPHSDRANTASFLEEVLKYIDSLKTRVAELENALATLKSSGKVASSAGAGILGAASNAPTAPVSAAMLRSEADFRAAGLGLGGGTASTSGQPGQQSVSLTLQQLQQHQLQQLLQQQQQQEAALAALQEQEQQKAALLAAQQLRQQQEQAAARQANLADLATQLGLRTVTGIAGSQSGTPQQQSSMDGLGSMLSKHGKDGRMGSGAALLPASSMELRAASQMTHNAGHAGATLHILPVQQLQLHNPTGELGSAPLTDGTNASSAAALTAAADAPKTSEGSSPVSSEESGVPLKKRKVLLL